MKSAPTWATPFEQVWTWAPLVKTCDSSKVSHMLGMLLPDLVWWQLAESLKGPSHQIRFA